MQHVPSLVPVSAMAAHLQTFTKELYRAGKMSNASESKHVRVAKWNNCGSQLACCYNDRTIRIWKSSKSDPKSSHEIQGAHIQSVEDISWHPEEPNLLASCSMDGSVKVWNAVTQRLIIQKSVKSMANLDIKDPKGLFCILRYSNDGNYIAVVEQDDWIIVLDSGSLQPVASYRAVDEIYDLAWANDDHHIAVALGNGSVAIYAFDTTSGFNSIKVLRGPHTAVTALAFDPRGYTLAAGSNDGIVSIWSLKDWICVNTFTKINEAVNSISYSFDGAYLAVAYDTEAAIDIVSTSPTVALKDEKKYLCSIPKPNKFHSRPTVSFCPSQYSLLYTGEDTIGVTVFHQA